MVRVMSTQAYEVGMTLTHSQFGHGVVTHVDGKYEHTVLTIDFPAVGTKRLLPKYAPLTTAEGTTYQPIASDFEVFDRKVVELAQEMRVREAAKALLAFEKAAANPADPFDAGTLAELLARPPEPSMRADGLIPSNASTLLVAQRKTGKTTLILNWARAVILGEPLLGRFDVDPIGGNVGLLNYEVSGHTVARWADEHGIPHHKLVVVNLRGRRNPLSHPDDRELLAEYLRDHDVEALAVDPFGRAFDGKSQNDAAEVTPWLVGLDTFCREDVGASDLLLAAHAGWNGERARGASALEDWADVIITMTRDEDDNRFLRAIGRDVDLDEDRLDFDPHTRVLTLSGQGSRQRIKAEGKSAELAVYVVRAVNAHHEVAGRAKLENLVKGMEDAPTFRNGDVSKAADFAARHGHLTIEDLGAGKPKIFRAVEVKA